MTSDDTLTKIECKYKDKCSDYNGFLCSTCVYNPEKHSYYQPRPTPYIPIDPYPWIPWGGPYPYITWIDTEETP